MINQKYYDDISKFPSQFETGVNLANHIKFDCQFDKAILCGMGGSSSFVDLINDFKAQEKDDTLPLFESRTYTLPDFVNEKTLVIIASYSGNTEEALSCLEKSLTEKYEILVVTSGGKLKELAEENELQTIIIPTGIQPRLSTGYFICGIMEVLNRCDLLKTENLEEKLLKAGKQIETDTETAEKLGKALKGKVPIIYGTDNNISLARMMKIKFNENSKTQSFWNYFPELNHNEMVGYTNMVMEPYFIIFKSKFTHPRNHKRIDVFTQLIKDKELPVEIIEMKGETVFEEILNAYQFIDYVTYYLAEEYGIDPEPVEMVEEFKKHILD